jgi:hypothetical protein
MCTCGSTNTKNNEWLHLKGKISHLNDGRSFFLQIKMKYGRTKNYTVCVEVHKFIKIKILSFCEQKHFPFEISVDIVLAPRRPVSLRIRKPTHPHFCTRILQHNYYVYLEPDALTS